MQEDLTAFLERESAALEEMEQLSDYSGYIHYDESELGETRIRSHKKEKENTESEPAQRHARPAVEEPKPTRKEKRRQMSREELDALRKEYERQEQAAREQYAREQEASIAAQIQAGPMPAVMAATAVKQSEPVSSYEETLLEELYEEHVTLEQSSNPPVEQEPVKTQKKTKLPKKKGKKQDASNQSLMMTMMLAVVAVIAVLFCILIASGKVPGLGPVALVQLPDPVMIMEHEMRCTIGF